MIKIKADSNLLNGQPFNSFEVVTTRYEYDKVIWNCIYCIFIALVTLYMYMLLPFHFTLLLWKTYVYAPSHQMKYSSHFSKYCVG